MKTFITSALVLGVGLVCSESALAATGSDLAARIAKQTGVSQTAAQKQVAAVFDSVEGILKDGEALTIRGFGRFYLQNREARKGRNPGTGEAINIPAKRYPRFASSDALKDRLNK